MAFPQNPAHLILVPGLKCTLSCPHCVNASNPFQTGQYSPEEIERLVEGANQLRPPMIVLTGGEPTLYTDLYESILSRLDYKFEVTLTTNGYFAYTKELVEKQLGKIRNLTVVQLSFDEFHSSKLDDERPLHLRDYCAERGIHFSIICCLASPMDLLFAAEAEERFGVPVTIQKIEGSGKASETKVEFQYPKFEETVLNMKCPNSTTVSNIKGKGFTVCCSNVIFNTDSMKYSARNVDELRNNEFCREVTEMTFLERMEKYGIDSKTLPARFSSPCNLCEHITLKAASY